MGEIVQNPDPQPISVSTAWTPLLDRDTMSYFGNNKVTLTNWDAGTVLPEIAQGSAIDIDGSMARFLTDEAIGGAPADGVVYVKFIVATDVVTPELTAEAPTWFNTLGGWYNGSGERYSGHLMTKSGSSYTDKGRYRDESDGDQLIIMANSGIDTGDISAGDISASSATLGPTTVNGQITVNGEVQGTSLDINGAGNISGSLVVSGEVDTQNLSVDVLADVQELSIRASGMTGVYQELLINGPTLIPSGCYMIASNDDTSGQDKVYLQVYSGSAWEGDPIDGNVAGYFYWPGGLVMSDGVNYRFNSSGGAVTLQARKIW